MASVSETNKVVFATICERCESTICESVSEMSFEDINRLHQTEGGKTFHVYHDRAHKALFRSLIYDTCRSC